MRVVTVAVRGPQVEQRDLPEEAAMAARIDDHAAAADLDGAGDNHVEVALVPAFVRQCRAGADLLHVGEFGDLLQRTRSMPANSRTRSSMAILSLMAGPFHG